MIPFFATLITIPFLPVFTLAHGTPAFDWQRMNLTAVSPAAIAIAPTPHEPALAKKEKVSASVPGAIPVVPFYSQFDDITAPEWKKIGCGVTSLAMIIDFYSPGAVSVNALLKQGITAGAYIKDAGWSHMGLVRLSQKYGLDGSAHDLSKSGAAAALAGFKSYVDDGPVIASVHYKFDPKSTIPHLVVIDGMDDTYVYYNDPASDVGGKKISIADFQKGWKKRFIVIRDVTDTNHPVATANPFVDLHPALL
jgi:uncharacterized protein YvpB